MTLTLRNIPSELDAALQKRAHEQNLPVDQVAVDAMKAGLGLANGQPIAVPNPNIAAAIRARFAPLGGIELADPIREPIRNPPDLGK